MLFPSVLVALAVCFDLAASQEVGRARGKFHHGADIIGRQDGASVYGSGSVGLSETSPAESGSSGSIVQQGYKAIAYYVDWAIYARNSPPSTIPAATLTHLNYAFGGINNKTGEAYLTDPYADVQKIYPGDVPSNSTNNSTMDLFGNLKQIYLLKKHNRNFKTLLSIGGWTLRTYFAPALKTQEGRMTFARTSVDLLKNLGFDGLDVDWEYPATAEEGLWLVETCRLMRQELDRYASNITGNPHFLLSLSVPAGPEHYQWFDVPGFNPYVDYINLMAYDYMGAAFSNFSGNAQNVYKSQTNPLSTDYDTKNPVDYYTNTGLPSQKLILGMPLYGRSFADTDGPGTKFGNTTAGSWEPGVWDYKVLPLANSSQIYTDDTIIASYSYGNESRLMVSYDTPDIAVKKTNYLVEKQLGGAMWWETSGDLPVTNPKSLIRTVTQQLKSVGRLEQSPNCLNYPESKYKNLREGMPGQ